MLALARGLAGWIGRRALLFVLLVAALLAHRLVVSEMRSTDALRASAATLGREAEALRGFTAAAVARSDSALAEAQALPRAALDTRIAAATRARDARTAACGSDMGALLRGGADAVVANRRRCVEARLLDREVRALAVLRDTAEVRRAGEAPGAAIRREAATMRREALLNKRKRGQVRLLRERTFGSVRFAPDIARLTREADAARAAYDAAKRRGETLLAAQRMLDAGRRRALAGAAEAQASVDRLSAETRAELSGSAVERARGWAERVGLDRVLRTALLAFAAILAAPYLVRLVFYFVLAPLAARRPAIRIGLGAGTIPPAPPSTTSVAIRLQPDEELLVRQDYLQSTGADAAKRTRWLLDWRYPLTSLAAGLWFLTRVRGQGAPTTVSAVRDPFAEVTIVTLPEGSACVLQPRALAAVVQPLGRPMRVSAHWRLGSLHAWLTLQLRYLVFRGPARLVVKGGRGVRVEQAEHGRMFGQDQLVGFGAGLRYSVARNETFWPYFLGREPLLRDRVEGGGMLIVEEAPMAGRRGGIGRGMEGAVDAVLKVFGI